MTGTVDSICSYPILLNFNLLIYLLSGMLCVYFAYDKVFIKEILLLLLQWLWQDATLQTSHRIMSGYDCRNKCVKFAVKFQQWWSSCNVISTALWHLTGRHSQYWLNEITLNICVTNSETNVNTEQFNLLGAIKKYVSLNGGSDGVWQSMTGSGECCIAWCYACGIFLICKISSTLLTHIICVYLYLPARYQG